MPDTQVNSQGSDQIVENRQQDAGQLHGNGQEPQDLNAMNPQAQAPQAQAQRIQEMLPRRQDPQAQAQRIQEMLAQRLEPQSQDEQMPA